ncbi:MAG: hypothetical protein JNM89_02190 [Hyphomicrobiaceae bacterium]|nr:hypothetical protein [Hyphomicrobiaceae bacterium]
MKASRTARLVDAEATVTLRDLADGAETATATETPVRLPRLSGAYWQADAGPDGVLNISVDVAELSETGTYEFQLIADSSPTVSDSPTTVHSVPITATGSFRFDLDLATIRQLAGDDAAYLAARIVIGGADPSINYAAWID